MRDEASDRQVTLRRTNRLLLGVAWASREILAAPGSRASMFQLFVRLSPWGLFSLCGPLSSGREGAATAGLRPLGEGG